MNDQPTHPEEKPPLDEAALDQVSGGISQPNRSINITNKTGTAINVQIYKDGKPVHRTDGLTGSVDVSV